jgi:hypothetical protein
MASMACFLHCQLYQDEYFTFEHYCLDRFQSKGSFLQLHLEPVNTN